MPQVSYASSMPSLSDKSQYPFFARTYPNDDLSAFLLVRLLSSFGWRDATVMHSPDSYGVGYAQAMSAAALMYDHDDDPLTELGIHPISMGDREADVRLALEAFKASGRTILVFALNAGTTDFNVFLATLSTVGLLTASYGIIFVNGDVLLGQASVLQLSANEIEQIAGLLTWSPTPTVLSGGYSRLKRIWQSLTTNDCLNDAFQPLPTSFFRSTPPSDLAAYVYDAVVAAAIAIERSHLLPQSVETGSHWGDPSGVPEADRRRIYANLLNVTFTGTTGNVRFERDGDRAAEGLTYVVGNLVLDEAGRMDPQVVRLIGGDGRVQVVQEPVWFEGSTKIPTDGLDDGSVESLAMLVGLYVMVSVAGSALIFGLAICTYRYIRHQKELRVNSAAFEKAQEAQIDNALALRNELQFACYTIAAEHFVALERLLAHETLRDKHLLKSHDELSELTKSDDKIIFFSHQVPRRSTHASLTFC